MRSRAEAALLTLASALLLSLYARGQVEHTLNFVLAWLGK